MATDWAADVKKYVPDADDGIIAGIVRYCGIALQKRDSSLVSMTDPAETKRVRENFLKKKLGLTHSDEKLDAAIAAVGERMKGENFKNRVTVYYLLAENFGLLGMFAKAAKAAPAAKGKPAASKSDAGKAAAGAAAVAGLASLSSNDDDAGKSSSPGAAAAAAGVAGAAALGAAGVAASTARPAASAVAAAAPAMFAGVASDSEDTSSGWGWLIWLLLAALVAGVLWWLFRGKDATSANGGVTTEQSAPATDAAVAATDAAPATPPPAEGTVAIPTGAGVTTEARDGKPVVKVYFDSGKADVVPAFTPAAGGLKAYLDSHAGSSLAVSGFNDPTGNAAFNAMLAKNRAEGVKAALVASGIADPSIALVPPAAATDRSTNLAGARRVEVVVK